MKILKYIITKDHEPILFSKNILHNDICKNAIRAGFLIIFINKNQFKCRVSCFGESTTLQLKSDKTKDRLIIETFLNSEIKTF